MRQRLGWLWTNLRLCGLGFPLGCAVLAFLTFLLAAADDQSFWAILAPYLAATILPLVFGLQATVILSPESDPALETLRACPRSLAAILGDRLISLAAVYGALAMLALAGAALLPEGVNWLANLAWGVPAAIFLAGVGQFSAQNSRNAAIGVLLVAMLWGGMLLAGDLMVTKWPWTWFIHLYLQPSMAPPFAFAVNRLLLALAGGILLFWGSRRMEAVEKNLVAGIKQKED